MIETERPNFYIDEKNTVGFSCEFYMKSSTIAAAAETARQQKFHSLTHCYYTVVAIVYSHKKKFIGKIMTNFNRTLIYGIGLHG